MTAVDKIMLAIALPTLGFFAAIAIAEMLGAGGRRRRR